MNQLNIAYATSILPRQIAERVGCELSDTNAIEYERKNFLRFLNERTGRKFTDQLDAWNTYDRISPKNLYDADDVEFLDDYNVLTYEERMLDELDKFEWLDQKEPLWIQRLKFRIIEQVFSNQENYNEYGGQQ